LLYHSYHCLTAPSSSVFYTLSLHDALPILGVFVQARLLAPVAEVRPGLPVEIGPFDPFVDRSQRVDRFAAVVGRRHQQTGDMVRSEEHTSELQSRENLVCRLLLEKKK